MLARISRISRFWLLVTAVMMLFSFLVVSCEEAPEGPIPIEEENPRDDDDGKKEAEKRSEMLGNIWEANLICA
ncbi:hypothetical protein GWO43_26205 [candidate division KSB1 bacterium]|nr:hypothetical protein [candidate division KSB1 bacterium]NIV69278.1 hypothetical protein [Phycisphaerae bacterium]NIR70779.1 hypothetical protein [candidate division KSB1 bacterium]NIS27451.1 hypothetical protein [candidate division KSB1 bacterium]NIT74304.1 hypothetical protein [candidate division KSB1 bacterium]